MLGQEGVATTDRHILLLKLICFSRHFPFVEADIASHRVSNQMYKNALTLRFSVYNSVQITAFIFQFCVCSKRKLQFIFLSYDVFKSCIERLRFSRLSISVLTYMSRGSKYKGHNSELCVCRHHKNISYITWRRVGRNVSKPGELLLSISSALNF